MSDVMVLFKEIMFVRETIDCVINHSGRILELGVFTLTFMHFLYICF